MNDGTMTRKQFAAVIFVALLSPLMRLEPRLSALLAGRGAFLCVIPAFFILWLLAALTGSFCRHMRPGEGMGELLMRWLGPVLGRTVLLIFAGWFLFYAGFILRSGAERLVATVYPSSGVEPFVFTLLGMCLLTSLGTLRAAGRAAVILQAILLGVLGIVFVFSLPNVSLDNLLPLTETDGLSVLLGAWPMVTVGGVAACFIFLSGYVEKTDRPVKWAMPHLALYLAVAGLLCAVVTATFGPRLTAQLSFPFFVMIRDVSILGLAQRIEAVVIALWVFTDFVLCLLLLRCAYEALRPALCLSPAEGRPMFALRRGRWLLLAEGGVVLLCSYVTAPSANDLLLWSDRLIPLISNSLIYGGLSLLWLVTIPKRRREKKAAGNNK
ncbi:MAG: GerAB/ArcD/ProY family transporter [Oscillospiraceae bacterium]|nr:GerAB/ArcD/ProY family transporter [Oscillospiraceae bacterium]